MTLVRQQWSYVFIALTLRFYQSIFVWAGTIVQMISHSTASTILTRLSFSSNDYLASIIAANNLGPGYAIQTRISEVINGP